MPPQPHRSVLADEKCSPAEDQGAALGALVRVQGGTLGGVAFSLPKFQGNGKGDLPGLLGAPSFLRTEGHRE